MTQVTDIIGDVHGQGDKLLALLIRLGYQKNHGSWSHPNNHQLLFIGDLIDRGSQNLLVIKTVRDLQQSGLAQALMGNHEFNAIALATPHPQNLGEHLRTRSEKNLRQVRAFLSETGLDTQIHKECVSWFSSLPLWLDHPNFRAIHACWDPRAIEFLSPHHDPLQGLTSDALIKTLTPHTDHWRAAERLCKGVEVSLPQGHSYQDPDGHERTQTRTRWWDEQAHSIAKAALVPKSLRASLPSSPLPDHAKIILPKDKPLFIGHYWLTGAPAPLTDHVVCVDYSAAKDPEPLMAYRFISGEPLSNNRFITHNGSWLT